MDMPVEWFAESAFPAMAVDHRGTASGRDEPPEADHPGSHC